MWWLFDHRHCVVCQNIVRSYRVFVPSSSFRVIVSCLRVVLWCCVFQCLFSCVFPSSLHVISFCQTSSGVAVSCLPVMPSSRVFFSSGLRVVCVISFVVFWCPVCRVLSSCPVSSANGDVRSMRKSMRIYVSCVCIRARCCYQVLF